MLERSGVCVARGGCEDGVLDFQVLHRRDGERLRVGLGVKTYGRADTEVDFWRTIVGDPGDIAGCPDAGSGKEPKSSAF